MEIFGIIIVGLILYIGTLSSSLKSNIKRDNARANGKHYYITDNGRVYSVKTNRQVLLGVDWYNGRHVQTLYDVNYHKITEMYDTRTNEEIKINGGV